jgi:hypothetical protein
MPSLQGCFSINTNAITTKVVTGTNMRWKMGSYRSNSETINFTYTTNRYGRSNKGHIIITTTNDCIPW